MNKQRSDLEELVRDPQWGIFWMLRAHVERRGKSKKIVQVFWQVWDQSQQWDFRKPDGRQKLLTFGCHMTPEEAARAALETVKATK